MDAKTRAPRLLFFLAGLTIASTASAHIEIASGPATADTSQEVVFSIEHGCQGLDTAAIQIDIPAGITEVRPVPSSDFATLEVQKDAGGTIQSVKWTKLSSSVFPSDLAYYQLDLLLKAPNQPFTTILFPTHQTCLAADGTPTVVDWIGADETSTTVEPAPAMQILPTLYPGWNQLTVTQAITDLSDYFSDALIVWKGDAAYSANPATVQQIAQTGGVTPLQSLSANDVIWVRY